MSIFSTSMGTSPYPPVSLHTAPYRGWCRAEFMGAWLAPEPKMCMIVRSGQGTPTLTYPGDALKMLPGLGDFTCCRLDHRLNGRPVPCDKPKIRGVLELMLEEKLNNLARAGLHEERRLVNRRTLLSEPSHPA